MNTTDLINELNNLNSKMKSFIRTLFSTIKDESNINYVLNSLDKNIKINSLLDVDFLFANFDQKIISNKDSIISYLKYSNFLYNIISKIQIKTGFINKYWKFNSREEINNFVKYDHNILDVSSFNNDDLNKLKRIIINGTKTISSYSPFYDGQKIIALSKYADYIK